MASIRGGRRGGHCWLHISVEMAEGGVLRASNNRLISHRQVNASAGVLCVQQLYNMVIWDIAAHSRVLTEMTGRDVWTLCIQTSVRYRQ